MLKNLVIDIERMTFLKKTDWIFEVKDSSSQAYKPPLKASFK